MPAELAAKIREPATFNEGYKLTELVAAAEVDMQWHTFPASAALRQPDAFEKQALEEMNLPLQLFQPRLGPSRLLRGLLRLSVDGDARVV